jgi:hypothetical protein
VPRLLIYSSSGASNTATNKGKTRKKFLGRRTTKEKIIKIKIKNAPNVLPVKENVARKTRLNFALFW